MIKNIGTTDKVIRIIAAVILVYLYYSQAGGGTAGIVFLVVAFILLGTAVIGWCGLYTLLGISTIKKEEPNPPANGQDGKNTPAQGRSN